MGKRSNEDKIPIRTLYEHENVADVEDHQWDRPVDQFTDMPCSFAVVDTSFVVMFLYK